MKLADRVLAGLAEAVAHARGQDVPGMVVHVPATLDVAAIRAKTTLSQPAFASSVGVSLGTLRQWEQRRRNPEGPARVLLAMVDQRPRIVMEVLGAPAPVEARDVRSELAKAIGLGLSRKRKTEKPVSASTSRKAAHA